MVNKLFRFFTVFDLFYYFFVLFLFKRNFFTHVILFTFPTKAYILYIFACCSLTTMPRHWWRRLSSDSSSSRGPRDQRRSTVSKQLTFLILLLRMRGQQLEQRTKRSEKKHGKQTVDILNTLIAHAWAVAWAEDQEIREEARYANSWHS